MIKRSLSSFVFIFSISLFVYVFIFGMGWGAGIFFIFLSEQASPSSPPKKENYIEMGETPPVCREHVHTGIPHTKTYNKSNFQKIQCNVFSIINTQ